MIVYVAAASSDRARAVTWIDKLTAAGITVSSTWPQVIAAVGANNPRDAPRGQRAEWSHNDLVEVEHAHVVWFLAPNDLGLAVQPARGAYFELGVAHALRKHVISSGDTLQSIFLALGEEYEDDVQAFGVLLAMAKERRRG